jgi:ubiquinone/menaquinone biosynthesis C-methylase UbiE
MSDEVAGSTTGPFSLGRAFKPESIDDDAVAQMVAILDEQDAMPSIERLRAWALDAARPQHGEQVVDVGSGTGSMTRRLAVAVGPGGRALGIEPNGMLRGVAEARAAEDGSGAVFCQGLATEIPLPDASADLVWCERVLQHVPDAGAAIHEMARVLRPGGRALILDSDHGSRVNSDIDPRVAHAITVAFMGQLANAAAARHIPRQAMAAGLVVDPDIGSSAVIYPRELLVDFPMLRMAAEQAVLDGTITREQAAAAIRGQSEAARQGWALSTVTVFGFVCRKP